MAILHKATAALGRAPNVDSQGPTPLPDFQLRAAREESIRNETCPAVSIAHHHLDMRSSPIPRRNASTSSSCSRR